MRRQDPANTPGEVDPEIFVGKDFFDGASIFLDGLPIFANRATKQRPPELQIHSHDFIEIAYVMLGEGVHEIAGQRFDVSKGDLYIINPGVPHRFISAQKYADDDFMICNVDFSEDLIGEANLRIRRQIDLDDVFLYSAFFEKNNTLPFYHLHVSGADMQLVEQVYESIYTEFQNRDPGYESMLFSYLMILLVSIFRCITGYDGRENSSRYKQNIIGEAIRYIDAHYADTDPELTLESLAAYAFMSKNYFSRLFREYTNQKFSRYLQNKRVAAACELLSTTDHKITDIIGRVGYRDVKHFNLIFKEITGCTPSEYRRREQKNG